MLAGELLHHALWWSGPSWLTGPRSNWPTQRETHPGLPELERRAQVTHLRTDIECPLSPLPLSVSSWPKLLRVTANCLRFTAALRRRQNTSLSHDPTEAMRRSRTWWLLWLQGQAFASDIARVQKGQLVSQSSPLRRLNPFLDDKGLLRVGGRLTQASLSYDEKHPVILPSHPVAELLIGAVHLATLHGGPQLTLSVLRRTYWPLRARELVRRVTWKCVTCARHRAATGTQLMAALPSARVTITRPFARVGVDYAGPIRTRMGKGRGYRAQKSYIGVFVCFVTRAIHLELISDCATSGFMAALRRFVSRRGRPTEIFSDNGTNFRGAARELAKLTRDTVRSPEVTAFLDNAEIAWRFSPPGAPHFGGLWEAGVKAVKRHLSRVIGSHTLTFEETATLLSEIEACLNSRPLTPLSTDPDDLVALTPGHFLTGTPLLSLPGDGSTDQAANPLTRWHAVERMRADFWKRWQQEYLHGLQERGKWWRPDRNLQTGELVVVREANSPPSCWRLARVTEVHPGSDDRVRVATVRTTGGTLIRPITQLVRLPVDVTDGPTTNELGSTGSLPGHLTAGGPSAGEV